MQCSALGRLRRVPGAPTRTNHIPTLLLHAPGSTTQFPFQLSSNSPPAPAPAPAAFPWPAHQAPDPPAPYALCTWGPERLPDGTARVRVLKPHNTTCPCNHLTHYVTMPSGTKQHAYAMGTHQRQHTGAAPLHQQGRRYSSAACARAWRRQRRGWLPAQPLPRRTRLRHSSCCLSCCRRRPNSASDASSQRS